MELKKITSQIETWITRVLDVPNNKFGDLPPCPYAKKAWLNGNVGVKMFDSKLFEQDEWDKEANIYVMNRFIQAELLSEMASYYNKKYFRFHNLLVGLRVQYQWYMTK